MKRREFLSFSIKAALATGSMTAMQAAWLRKAGAVALTDFLSDPAAQPLFVNDVPNAMAAAFKYVPKRNKLRIIHAQTTQFTGLVDGGSPQPRALGLAVSAVRGGTAGQ